MSSTFVEGLLLGRLDSIISSLRKDLSLINVGRPNPDLIGTISLEYCGSTSCINYLAGISVVDDRTIVVKPYDRDALKLISDAIMVSDLGLNPINNGEYIKVVFPPLSEERRLSLVRRVKSQCEDAKIAIRNLRHKVRDEIKNEKFPQDTEKVYNDELQRIIDRTIDQVESIVEEKSRNIMKV